MRGVLFLSPSIHPKAISADFMQEELSRQLFNDEGFYLKSILDEIESCARNDMSRMHFRYLLLRCTDGWRSVKSFERALHAVGSDSMDRSS